LTNLGISYVPSFITREEYNLIVSSPNESGRGSGMTNQNRKVKKQYRGGR